MRETKSLSDNIMNVARGGSAITNIRDTLKTTGSGFKIVNENLNLAEGPFPTMQAAQNRLRELNASSPSFARFRKIVRI
jgi:hypothetical protein